jgi:hypothetical protein
MTTNPWRRPHLEAEYAFHDDPRTARRLVELEYEGAPDPVMCRCGDTAYWRATVGALMCPRCRTLYRSDGRLIG